MANKKGSKRIPTRAGLPLGENLRLAVFGTLNRKPATWLAHQLWLSSHPSKGFLAGLRKNFSVMEIAEIIEKQTTGFLSDFVAAEFSKRIRADDWEFFADFAETIRRLAAGEVPCDSQRAAIASFVQAELAENPKRKFAPAELLERPHFTQGWRPSEDTIERIIDELEIPMIATRRGRPRKK